MAEVGATYPKWDAEAKRPVNVELQNNDCRENNMKAAPYKFDALEQKALTTYIKHQAPGTPMNVDLSEGEKKDRECVGQGKRVSVRVDLGRRSILKTKKI